MSLIRTAVVNNGMVVNIVEFEGSVPSTPIPGQLWVASDTAQIGWGYVGGAFIAPPSPPVTPPTMQQQAQVALAVGLQIVSTGTPGVSGTYALDAASQQKILTVFAAIGAGIQTGNVNYPDASGAIHTFTPAEFQAFTAAVYAYVQTLDEVVMGVTGVALPVQPVTIP